MERVGRAELSSALTVTGGQLQKRLPDEELKALGALMEQMSRRWPAQDVSDSMDVYLEDYERLAVQHGLPYVQIAVMALRVSPDQKFFPRPDELAAEIRRQRELRTAQMDVRRAIAYCNQLAEWKRRWQAEQGAA